MGQYSPSAVSRSRCGWASRASRSDLGTDGLLWALASGGRSGLSFLPGRWPPALGRGLRLGQQATSSVLGPCWDFSLLAVCPCPGVPRRSGRGLAFRCCDLASSPCCCRAAFRAGPGRAGSEAFYFVTTLLEDRQFPSLSGMPGPKPWVALAPPSAQVGATHAALPSVPQDRPSHPPSRAVSFRSSAWDRPAGHTLARASPRGNATFS